MNIPATQGDLQGTLMFLHSHCEFMTHPEGDKSIPERSHDFCSENVPLYLCNAVAITTEFSGLRSYATIRVHETRVTLPQRSVEWNAGLTICIYDASQAEYWNERGTTRGALCLNPWTLSLHYKRVLARYLAVESQPGRVAGREAERKREGGRASPGRRECNLQIRGRDEFLLPAWPCQGNGGARVKLRFQDRSESRRIFIYFFINIFFNVRVSFSRVTALTLWFTLNVCGHTGSTHEMCVEQTVSGTDHTAWNPQQSV